MAFTGHSGMHTAQSIHSSGSMISMFGPSRKQSTGHTSTQSVYLHLMQDSVTTCVISSFSSYRRNGSHAAVFDLRASERLARPNVHNSTWPGDFEASTS